MTDSARVVHFDGVIFLVLVETEPVSTRPERDGYIERESVYVAGRPERDPTGRTGGIHPTWDRIAYREPAVTVDPEAGRAVIGETKTHWRHRGGCGSRRYAIEDYGNIPSPQTRPTPLESVRISDWARSVIMEALTQACNDLWTINCMRPESVADVQELWTRHIVQVSSDYVSEVQA